MSQTTHKLPDVPRVSSLLSALLGKDVDVQQITGHDLAGNVIQANYCGDDGDLKRVIRCDQALANRMGASLTMIPPRWAEEAIANDELPAAHIENMNEIFNICVNLLTDASETRLVLKDVEYPSNNETTLGETVTFKLDIPSYGEGVISMSAID